MLALRKKAWSNIERGWKLYEPLPQTPEETVLWKQFTADWSAWKTVDDRLGATIARVTDIMGEITMATQEQSSGIDQINMAVGQMDTVTQQNAASLEEQAARLAQVVSVFRLDGAAVHTTALIRA